MSRTLISFEDRWTKQLYQNRLQSQGAIPSRHLTCVPGANNCPADGLILSIPFQGFDPAICISSLEIDSSFTYVCPFVRPKLFRYGIVVVRGSGRDSGLISGKKTFKKHLST